MDMISSHIIREMQHIHFNRKVSHSHRIQGFFKTYHHFLKAFSRQIQSIPPLSNPQVQTLPHHISRPWGHTIQPCDAAVLQVLFPLSSWLSLTILMLHSVSLPEFCKKNQIQYSSTFKLYVTYISVHITVFIMSMAPFYWYILQHIHHNIRKEKAFWLLVKPIYKASMCYKAKVQKNAVSEWVNACCFMPQSAISGVFN